MLTSWVCVVHVVDLGFLREGPAEEVVVEQRPHHPHLCRSDSHHQVGGTLLLHLCLALCLHGFSGKNPAA